MATDKFAVVSVDALGSERRLERGQADSGFESLPRK